MRNDEESLGIMAPLVMSAALDPVPSRQVAGFVAVASVVSMLACLVLLAVASRRKVMSGDNTTGHVWDEDLREANNPLPMWWVGLFVITIVFGLGYLFVFPGLGSRSTLSGRRLGFRSRFGLRWWNNWLCPSVPMGRFPNRQGRVGLGVLSIRLLVLSS